MKNRLKFRAWSFEKEKMIYNVFPINNIAHAVTAEDCDFGTGKGTFKMHTTTNDRKCPLMQSTGLIDKNGNEIYEGDVLRGYFNIDDVENHIYLQLTEKEKKNCYKIFLVDNIHFGYSYPIPEILEIIGNRFENPELLEAVK